MATVNLHPSGTVTSNQNWTLTGGTSAHGILSDSDDVSYIRDGNQNQYCVVELDNFTATADSITSIRWYIRAAYALTRGGTLDIQVVLGTGSHAPISGSADAYYTENVTITFNAGYARQDYYGTARTTDGSSAWDATSLNSLRLDINTSPADPPAISQAYVSKAYVEVTYVEPTAVTDNSIFFGTNF
jgi:hypothetical protein